MVAETGGRAPCSSPSRLRSGSPPHSRIRRSFGRSRGCTKTVGSSLPGFGATTISRKRRRDVTTTTFCWWQRQRWSKARQRNETPPPASRQLSLPVETARDPTSANSNCASRDEASRWGRTRPTGRVLPAGTSGRKSGRIRGWPGTACGDVRTCVWQRPRAEFASSSSTSSPPGSVGGDAN